MVIEKTAAGQFPFDVEQRQSGYVVSYPLQPYNTTARVVTAEFLVRASRYQMPAINSPLTDNFIVLDQTLIFCKDSPLADAGLGIARFTRTWATVPASWAFPQRMAYSYPGILGAPTLQRITKPKTTLAVVNRVYFLCGPGQTYSIPFDLALPAAFEPIYGLDSNGNPLTVLSTASSPTAAAYLATVAADNATAGLYSLLAEDTTVEPYLGNIWCVVQRFVKAR